MAQLLEFPLFVPRRQARPDGSIWGQFIVCTVCGNTGLGVADGQRPLPWAQNCFDFPDHPFRCGCGMRYPSKAALAAHVRANDRWGHKGHWKVDVENS